jgi:Ca-activated chloride channel family protein
LALGTLAAVHRPRGVPPLTEALEWLRPEWLFALPAGLALLWLWWRAQARAGPWRRLVDPALLPHVVERAPITSAAGALGIAATALVLTCVALAGPSWRSNPAPLIRELNVRVVVLDLSPSMDAVDVVPSRLEHARAAIVGILRESSDAQLGLVVFGADAFTVAPLMNDASALVHLLGSLGTATLPRAGSRPDLGLDMARALLVRAGVAAGDVILVGDSAGDERTLAAARTLASAGFPLSVLAVGTPHGGPVRLASGAFARTDADEILIAKADLAALERVARAGGGRFHALDAGDVRKSTPRFAQGARRWAESPEPTVRETNQREDGGAWFALLALPFAALLFRRGWLAGLAAFVLTLTLPQQPAQAFEWPDLWQRPDQQAAAEFATGRFGDHAALLSKLRPDSPWQAVLLYRSGRFAEAAALFAAQDSADAHYNRGNALALEGRLEEALDAYRAALERSPSMRDALFNRALVREALAQRRAQARRGARAQQSRHPDAALPSTTRPGSGSAGRSHKPVAGPNAARRESRSASGAGQAQPRGESAPSGAPAEQDDAKRRLGDVLSGSELQRLEGLLAEVPDNPGSLLANRFAWQLRLRGNWHYDTGARW